MRRNKLIGTISILIVLIFVSSNMQAQILNRLKSKVREKVESKVVNKVEEGTDKAIDKTEEAAKRTKGEKTDEEGIIILTGKDEKQGSGRSQTGGTLQDYRNYDFVPGDKLIYFYDMTGERDAEIPGRMLLHSGNAEIQTFQNEKVLIVPGNGEAYMAPQIKENNYLPEQFTVEFDILTNGVSNLDGAEIYLYFREKSRAGSGDATAPVKITLAAISGDEDKAHYGFECFNNDNWVGTAFQRFPKQAQNSTQNNWRHIAVYINKNIGKLYVDLHRLAVINQVNAGKINMMEIEVRNTENAVLFKNFRIASGGDDAYNKVVTDGKFIAYGIQFDVNKATLKPESMGTINEFVKMMNQYPELEFEIGGHTDSDGAAQRNDELSRERAEVVKSQMVKSGIEDNRLTTKGYGSTKPVAKNDNVENKARNRRVEFVKS